MSSLSLKPIACAIAMALAPCMAFAQASTAKADAGAQKELASARADLARAARRVAELSRATSHAEARTHVQKQRTEHRPIVGIVLAPDEQAGVRIAGVTPDGPASKAGLKSGDRLVSINGAPILGQEPRQRIVNARKLLGEANVKKTVQLGYARAGRNAVVSVVPKVDQHVFVWKGDGADKDFTFDDFRFDDFRFDFDDADFEHVLPAGVAPQIRRELIRIGPDGKCKGEDCRFKALTEAFRWNGLNLATIDPQLGRYFGTESGVLVLSAGEDLAGLQAGDVIRKVDGKTVSSPREAMAALRAKPANSKVSVEYMRDRKAATAQVTVPKAMPFRMPTPPTPPASPAPPRPPATPRPPMPPKSAMAPAAPAVPRMVESRRIVTIDRDGKRHTWEYDDDGHMAPPPLPPTPPQPPAPPAAPSLVN